MTSYEIRNATSKIIFREKKGRPTIQDITKTSWYNFSWTIYTCSQIQWSKKFALKKTRANHCKKPPVIGTENPPPGRYILIIITLVLI